MRRALASIRAWFQTAIFVGLWIPAFAGMTGWDAGITAFSSMDSAIPPPINHLVRLAVLGKMGGRARVYADF